MVAQDKLNDLIDFQKEVLGRGLLASLIWTSTDGQLLINFNSTPQASSLFNQITQVLLSAMQGSEMPKLGRYYVIDMADDALGIVIVMGEFQWGMIIDKTRTALGLFLNMAMPELINAFKEAVA
ncbi:MAG TPA: hypothetical protein DCM26_05435 [Desulfotomaculum sp.]|nr:hypothetical protein [Desulfotomaculum sp.]